MMPPRNPAPVLTASMPPIRPGVRRAIRDGEGDETGQYRHHQRKGGAAANLHQRRRQRAFDFKRLDAEHERQRDTQTAGHHHRQHVGHAGQQVAIRAVALFLLPAGAATALLRLEHLGLGQRLVQFLGGFLQRQAGGSAVHRLTGKLIQIHLDIRRDDHQIRRSHFFRGDGVAGTDGAARFHLHPPAAFLRFAFNGFGRHKGVRHAGWASGDRHDAFCPSAFTGAAACGA